MIEKIKTWIGERIKYKLKNGSIVHGKLLLDLYESEVVFNKQVIDNLKELQSTINQSHDLLTKNGIDQGKIDSKLQNYVNFTLPHRISILLDQIGDVYTPENEVANAINDFWNQNVVKSKKIKKKKK